MFELTSFEDRRARGDMVVAFRAMHGFFDVDLEHLFRLNTNHLRGHGFKLAKESFRTTCRRNFLSNRIFDAWNRLPNEVVNAATVNEFKNKYDRCKRSS